MIYQQSKTRLQQIITLKELKVYQLDLPQKIVFTSGIGTRKSKETLIIQWTDTAGRIGYGECSCRPDPYYSVEYLSAAVGVIERFIAPRLKASQTYEEIIAILDSVRGWNFTKSAIEAAILQIVKQQSSYQLADELKPTPISNVPVGISLGIYHDVGEFKEVVQEAIDAGYHRLKFKISPQVNIDNFEAINPLLFDNNIYTSFDANGSFTSGKMDKLGYFVATYPNAIEQPTPPSRFDLFLEAKQLFPDLKVCFDEEVENIGDLIKLHQLGLIDEFNLKVGRVGGISPSIAMVNYCHDNAIPCWVGGMFETGIGRILNLEFASFMPQAQAHDLSPSSRYFEEDIVAPAVQMNNGYVSTTAIEQTEVQPQIIDKYAINSWTNKSTY